MPQNEIMTIQEVAKYLRVSERTIYGWASKGQIPCGKLGSIWRFKRSEIESWVDKRLGTEKAPIQPTSIFIKDLLSPERILLFDTSSKKEALTYLINSLADTPEVKNKNNLSEEIFRRESLMSTGIGMGIGIPHVRLESVEDILMAVGISKSAIEDYESLDDKPVRMIFMVAAGKDQHTEHIQTIAAISSKLKDDHLRKSILEAKNNTTVFNLLS